MATFGGSFTTFGQSKDAGSAFSFGAQAPATTVANTGFNFGGFGSSTTAAGGFTSTAPASTPFAFGTQQPATTVLGGFPSFGAPTVTTAPLGGFSFGTSGGTLSTAPATGFGGFNLGTSTSAPSFGGFSGFGTSTAAGTGTGFNSFGLGLNAPAATTSAFSFGGGLGTTSAGGGLFGKPGFGQTTQPASNEQTLGNFMTALLCPVLYGDERDSIIAKWNQLQAYWGTGTGYFSAGALPITFTPDNCFCKFKAVGYSCLPTSKNEDGFISFIIEKSDVEVRTLQPQLIDGIFKMLGSNSTLTVCVEGVKPSAENQCEVIIYVMERAATGLSKRVLASDLYNYFNSQNIKTQLTAFGIQKVIVKAKPTPDQLRLFLEAPPAGMDQVVWQQACKDNPDPERFIPVPMIGFGELNRRLKHQEEETKVHESRLHLIGSELNDLQNKLTVREAKISEFKRTHLELCHRVLKIMIKQEVSRKLGLALQADEEILRAQLEKINTDLSAPNQTKGRLKELMSQIRLQKENFTSFSRERYNVDPSLQEELKRHLKKEQEGLNHMVNVQKENFEYLKKVSDKLKEDAIQK